jgi:formylglycine-generating enzyme required for sulfatase activity
MPMNSKTAVLRTATGSPIMDMKQLLCSLLVTGVLTAGESPVLRLVDYGSDHGFGWYRNTQGAAWKDAVDVDGDGDTADDSIGGWPFSLEVPFSPPDGDYDAQGPSAVFHGGAIGRIANHRMGLSEGHTNANHEWRDDFNLMGLVSGAEKSGFPPGMLLAAHGCWLWRKEGFLGGGDRWQVGLDAGCRIAVHISRYWGGLDWGRFVVQDADGMWISEASFGEGMAGTNGGANATTRRTHAIDPGRTRWASWKPSEKDLAIDLAAAVWSARSFSDVRAVGFAVSRALSPPVTVTTGLLANQPLALKWNAVSVDARIARPDGVSAWLPRTVTTGGLVAAATPIDLATWERVRRWAVTNQHTENDGRGFSFDRDGQALSGSEAVHTVAWADAAAWCNALSQLDGRRPVYWADAARSVPFRRVVERDVLAQHATEPPVFADPAADGWRLPTPAEAAVLTGGRWVWAHVQDAAPGAPRRAAGGQGSAPAVWDGPVALAIGRGCMLIGVQPVRGPLAAVEAPVWDVATDAVVQPAAPLTGRELAQRVVDRLAPVRRAGAASAVSAIAGYNGKELKGVETDGAVAGDLLVAGRETAWADWSVVRAWAEAHGYRFDRDGRCGSVGWGDQVRRHDPLEPVTLVSWEDALVWCNALSELAGLRPAYRTPEGEVLRQAQRLRLDTWQQPEPGTKILWPHRIVLDAAADGWRLPSAAERARFAGPVDDSGWRPPRSDGSTRPVTAGTAVDGLVDLHGNVAEWLWQAGPCGLFGRPLGVGHYASVNPIATKAFTMVDEHPLAARPFIGFRIVRRMP